MGKDVFKALIAWPKCPICGQWMRIGGHLGGVWACEDQLHEVRWSPSLGWHGVEKARRRAPWKYISQDYSAPALSVGEAERIAIEAGVVL